MTWTAVAFVPAAVSTAYQAAGSPAQWDGTIQNRQWHLVRVPTGLKSYRWDEVTALGSTAGPPAAHQPNTSAFHPVDFIPPLHGEPALTDPKAPNNPGVPTTDAGLSGSWCECDRYEGPIATLGATPTFHDGRWWVQLGKRTMFFGSANGSGTATGTGAHAALPNPQNRPEINAADDLLAYFDTNACTRESLPVVTAFQNAYNASSLPGRLTPDGQYGPNTQSAVQLTLDEAQSDSGSGPSQSAPTNCFGGAIPTTPSVDPTPSTPPTPGGSTPTPSSAPTGPNSSRTPLIIGGFAVAGAALIGYTYWKKHHRGRRS
jgi:hypothetical protein